MEQGNIEQVEQAEQTELRKFYFVETQSYSVWASNSDEAEAMLRNYIDEDVTTEVASRIRFIEYSIEEV